MRVLGQAAGIWFEKRGISAETAARYNVYTGSKSDFDGAVIPNPRGNILVFPYVDHGVDVGEKYRLHPKQFWQRTGGKKTFWNADVLDDPALHDGRAALVITEGEIDALTAIDCGYPFAASVPDGAPPVPDGKRPDDLEPVTPTDDQSGKFEYMWNNRERLKKIKRFIIAADADAPGQRLAAEIVRRLSAAKCSFVLYPDGCKDLNDVRQRLGSSKVMEIINSAQPYPVRGLYRLSEYPGALELQTFPCGWDGWTHILRLFLGEFLVVSGVPSHGKTVWVLNLVANLATLHGWPVAICSPEMPTVPVIRDRFRRFYIGHKPVLSEPDLIARADDWIERNFVFLDTDPTGTGESDENFDLEWIIERATDAVLRDGIRALVIDPWNEIEHARGKMESTSDYIARGIRMLKRFARLYGVVVIVVAHPTKEVGKDGRHRTVTLYDVEGSAAWFNKADHGIIVERRGNVTTVHIQKVRFEESGVVGSYVMKFDQIAGRFKPELAPEDDIAAWTGG
jgi:twinkle protein